MFFLISYNIEENKLYAWGDNKNGQLGLGDRLDRDIPTPLELNLPRITKIGTTTDNNSYLITCNALL
jgi:alpha-tubulin suppressor-like RCC1 family protein